MSICHISSYRTLFSRRPIKYKNGRDHRALLSRECGLQIMMKKSQFLWFLIYFSSPISACEGWVRKRDRDEHVEFRGSLANRSASPAKRVRSDPYFWRNGSVLSVLYCLPWSIILQGISRWTGTVLLEGGKGGGGWERILSVFNKLGYHRVDFLSLLQ